MYSIDSIDGMDLGIACIVFSLYIVGKVWMYYRIENPENPKKNKSKGLIKRGNEWE